MYFVELFGTARPVPFPNCIENFVFVTARSIWWFCRLATGLEQPVFEARGPIRAQTCRYSGLTNLVNVLRMSQAIFVDLLHMSEAIP